MIRLLAALVFFGVRIFAEPFTYNIASCRVLEKAGFQFEGLLRNNAVKNGTVLDMRMYSLIKEAEREIKNGIERDREIY